METNGSFNKADHDVELMDSEGVGCERWMEMVGFVVEQGRDVWCEG